MVKHDPFRIAIVVALSARGETRRDLARRLGVPHSTFSDWLNGEAKAPPDLVSRIESALGMRTGSLPPPRGAEHIRDVLPRVFAEIAREASKEDA